ARHHLSTSDRLMKKSTQLILALATASLAAAIYALYATSRFSVEQARYTVLRQEGPFEIRDYPDLMIARTSLDASGNDSSGNDSAFRRLFRFINRGNVRRNKISMTAPVFVDGHSEMSFILPEDIASTPPDATVDGVTLQKRAAARVAVYRFGSSLTRENEDQASECLYEWTRKQGITTSGKPTIAVYDSPMIPAPLRRNEAMLKIEG
ncbi:MAG: heme-binding protein, partial [Chthoniobacterales bacterium]